VYKKGGFCNYPNCPCHKGEEIEADEQALQDFYDDMSKIRKFEKQAKAGTITGKQAEDKCKKLILAMPKKYRTLTDRKIKSTIKDLLASI
jgi:predicted RNA-binding Zn ribbon-like protein